MSAHVLSCLIIHMHLIFMFNNSALSKQIGQDCQISNKGLNIPLSQDRYTIWFDWIFTT